MSKLRQSIPVFTVHGHKIAVTSLAAAIIACGAFGSALGAGQAHAAIGLAAAGSPATRVASPASPASPRSSVPSPATSTGQLSAKPAVAAATTGKTVTGAPGAVAKPAAAVAPATAAKAAPPPTHAPAAPAQAPAQATAPAYPNNLNGWINQAISILSANGYSVSYNAIYQTAMNESSGNPSAVNNWDSNAAAGNASAGLMQVVPTTFAAYALPGHTDIYNPVDNIIAAVRYAAATYGSLDNVVAARCGGSCWYGY